MAAKKTIWSTSIPRELERPKRTSTSPPTEKYSFRWNSPSAPITFVYGLSVTGTTPIPNLPVTTHEPRPGKLVAVTCGAGASGGGGASASAAAASASSASGLQAVIASAELPKSEVRAGVASRREASDQSSPATAGVARIVARRKVPRNLPEIWMLRMGMPLKVDCAARPKAARCS